MERQFIGFGSIEKFESVMKDVKHRMFHSIDENGEKSFDRYAKLPTVYAIGSEKIHGTNASVCVTDTDFWVQKKSDIITPQNDNASCAFYAELNKDAWIKIAKELAHEYNIDMSKNIITIYYEWCGGNIQDRAAVSGLDKRAIVFQYFKVTSEDGSSKWLETKARYHKKPDGEFHYVEDKDNLIFNIMNFQCYLFKIDFENPNVAIEEMIDVVLNKIEPNSPVGNGFGIDGNIGEGIVVTFMFKEELFRFKVKGEKHSKSKVKTLQPIENTELEKRKIAIASQVTSALRLEQAMQTVFGIANEKKEPTIKDTGEFIKAVMADIVKEELDEIAKAGFDLRSISGFVSKIASNWFQEYLRNNI